jgi:hypothetical protein
VAEVPKVAQGSQTIRRCRIFYFLEHAVCPTLFFKSKLILRMNKPIVN